MAVCAMCYHFCTLYPKPILYTPLACEGKAVFYNDTFFGVQKGKMCFTMTPDLSDTKKLS